MNYQLIICSDLIIFSGKRVFVMLFSEKLTLGYICNCMESCIYVVKSSEMNYEP